mgnify:CR=1 FL=1
MQEFTQGLNKLKYTNDDPYLGHIDYKYCNGVYVKVWIHDILDNICVRFDSY